MSKLILFLEKHGFKVPKPHRIYPYECLTFGALILDHLKQSYVSSKYRKQFETIVPSIELVLS